MSTLYHWSDSRSDFALDEARPLARRLRPSLLATKRTAATVVPWAILLLALWSMLSVFA